MFLVEQKTTDKGAEIHVFSRKNGVKQVDIINTFLPYFYIPENEVLDSNKIVKIEKGYKSLFGEPLKKIFCRKPEDVASLRSSVSKHFEGDISFNNRYIIDVIGPIEPYPLKTLIFDIEVDTTDIFPNIEIPDMKIISIALSDTFTNKETVLLLKNKNTREYPDTIVCDTEEELLSLFLGLVRKIDPDIIANWNINGFDLPYLIRRMEQFKIDYHKLSPMNYVKINMDLDDKTRVKIKGRVVIDSMDIFKRYRVVTSQGIAESYSLQNVAQTFLGIGKVSHKETMNDLWMNNPEKLIEYNKRDVWLVKELENKLKIIDFFNGIRCMACCQLDDVYHSTKILDGFLLRECLGNPVLPSKKKVDENPFKGAFVFEPRPGVYEYVIVVDVMGMYPSIIKTFNISPETIDINGDIVLGDVKFKKEPIGLVPKIIAGLGESRKKEKQLMKESKTNEEKELHNQRQVGFKILGNALYGYISYPGSRLYNKSVGAAVTRVGRELSKWNKTFAENNGYEVLGSDTDSLFIKAKNSSFFEILNEGKELQEQINGSYKKFALERNSTNCQLFIEFEKIIGKILFVGKRNSNEGAKKKYAYTLLWKGDDKVDPSIIKFTGFGSKRSDSCKLYKEVQNKIVKMVLNSTNKNDIFKYLETIEMDIRKGKYGGEWIGNPRGISEKLEDYKVKSPVVNGCLFSNKYLGTRFGKASKPKWIYVKRVPHGFPETDTIAFEDEIPQGFVPDYDKIVERVITMNTEQILKSAGIEYETSTGNKGISQWL